MPSSACGTGSPCRDSNRKKWQDLWIVLPRNRKDQLLTWVGPGGPRGPSPRLSRHLAAGCLGGRLTRLEMPLREAPVLVRVADEQEAHHSVRAAPAHHAAGTRLSLRSSLGPLHVATQFQNAERGRRNAEQTVRRSGRAASIRDRPSPCSSAFRVPTSALVLEHAEREVFARIGLDVGQKLPQLDHGEGGLAV